MTPFQQQVFAVVKRIPKGSVLSYAEVAAKIGRPRAYRAVANALAKNTDRAIPCHRVIRADGKIGGYNGLRGSKRKLLKREGVAIL